MVFACIRHPFFLRWYRLELSPPSREEEDTPPRLFSSLSLKSQSALRRLLVHISERNENVPILAVLFQSRKALKAIDIAQSLDVAGCIGMTSQFVALRLSALLRKNIVKKIMESGGRSMYVLKDAARQKLKTLLEVIDSFHDARREIVEQLRTCIERAVEIQAKKESSVPPPLRVVSTPKPSRASDQGEKTAQTTAETSPPHVVARPETNGRRLDFPSVYSEMSAVQREEWGQDRVLDGSVKPVGDVAKEFISLLAIPVSQRSHEKQMRIWELGYVFWG